MIKIVAKMPVKPECVEEFKKAVKPLVEGSAAEAGNVYYTLNVSISDPNLFAIMECWKDQAAIDFHNAAPHFTSVLPELRKFMAEGSSVELYNEVEF
jgi:quinol monooxygenase YgiN